MFRTVPLSVIRSFSPYTQQWYISYRLSSWFYYKSLSRSPERQISYTQVYIKFCMTVLYIYIYFILYFSLYSTQRGCLTLKKGIVLFVFFSRARTDVGKEPKFIRRVPLQ